MEHIKIHSETIERLKTTLKPKQKGIYNQFQEIAWEACQFFKETNKFGQYYKYISIIGVDEARRRILNQQEQGIREPKFFFKKTKPVDK